MTLRSAVRLLSLLVLISLLTPVASATCIATLTARETSPGEFMLTATGFGSCTDPNQFNVVKLWYLGLPLASCWESPCTFEWPMQVRCAPRDVTIAVQCYKNISPSGCDEDAWGSATVHMESNHDPSISSKDAIFYGGNSIGGSVHVHAAAAITRVITYEWLPSHAFAGSTSISGMTPDDFDSEFGFQMPPDAKFLKATITSCGDASASTLIAAQDNACSCSSGPAAPTCVGHPINVATGNMRMSDTDPLPSAPGLSLTRIYDSSGTSRRFGQGWTSLLDPALTSFPADGSTYVMIETGEGTSYVFRSVGAFFRQVWPQNGIAAALTYDGAAGTYTLHQPQHDIDLVARASDGVPLLYHSRSTGRDISISYTGSTPAHVSDSWGNWGWTLSSDPATGRIVAIAIDGTSDTWQYTYDTGGALIEVHGPNNALWRTYTYSGGHLTEARDAAGRLIESHQYDSQGRAVTSQSDQGDIRSIDYGSPYVSNSETATSVTSATGVITQYNTRFYGGRPRTSRIIGNCSGCGVNDAVYAYDNAGNIVREQDARGYVQIRVFDWLGRVTSLTVGDKPAGCDPETDASHCRLTPDTLATAVLGETPATTTTTYTYEDVNWPDRPTLMLTTSVANPAAVRVVNYTYDTATGILINENTEGWRTPTEAEIIISSTTLYDGAAGAAFNPGGSFDPAWLAFPQPAGLKRSFNGPRTDVADVTEWVYYPVNAAVPSVLRGHVAAIRDAAGNITRFEAYDGFGNATRIVDANGVATESAYDAAGRLLTTTLKGVAGCDTALDPLCATDLVTQRTYDLPLGPLASETRPNGGITTYEYDNLRRMTAMTRAISAAAYERAEYDYDVATGKRSAERYKSGQPGAWTQARSEGFAYDTYARLREIDHPDGTKIVYTYDVAGNVKTVQDERHTTPNTTYSYDPRNRLAAVRQTLSTAPGGSIVTQYGYDKGGNLTSVTDPNGNTTTYAFDDFGRMHTQTSPVTGTTSYSYDPAGNLTSTVDANGATTTRTYDALNRVTAATSTRAGAPPESITWSYDDASAFGRGRLATMADPTGSTAYRYERRGLLASEIKSIQGAAYTSAYSHDRDGNRSTMTYPSGRIVAYLYDLAGRPTSAASADATYVSSASYLPFGPATQIDFGNGTHSIATFDNRYRPLSRRLTGPSGTIAESTYTTDGAANISSIHDALDHAYDRDFGYDDLNRLVRADTGASLWAAGTFAYDAMGNMTSASAGARARSFSYDGPLPRLTSVTENGTPRSVTYDAAGNEMALGTVLSAYSPREHLQSAEGFTYGYDGRSVRVISAYAGALSSLAADHQSILGTQSVAFTVTLRGPAPAGGTVVTLSSSNSAALAVPPSVNVSEGSTSTTFTATAADVAANASATITATNLFASSVTISVDPMPSLASFTVDATTAYASQILHGTVALSAPSTSAPIAVALTSSNPAALSVPVPVTVAAGSTTATFDMTASAVAAPETTAVTATLRSSIQQTISVVPTMIATVSISPAAVTAPSPATGTVTLSGVVPPAGAVVTLTSSDPAVATVPASIAIPSGQSTGTFTVTTYTAPSSTTVTVTATNGGVTRSTSLSVGTCSASNAAPPSSFPSADEVWIDDGLPAGASFTTGTPLWDAGQFASGQQSLTMPYSGQSSVNTLQVDGLSKFVKIGSNIAFYVLIDPCQPTREIKITYGTGGRTAADYWGDNLIGGPAVRFSRGALPATGQWVRVEAPASTYLRIEGQTVHWMQIETYGGQVWFDHIGTNGLGCTTTIAPAPAVPPTDRVLIEDGLPSGSDTYGSSLLWDPAQKASGSQSYTSPYVSPSSMTMTKISPVWFPIAGGDTMIAYVMPNNCVAVREIKLTYFVGGAEHAAYWGEARLGGESSSVFMGATLPPQGTWTRLEVPASTLGLEGNTVDAVRTEYYAGQVWFDHIGAADPPPVALTSFTADHPSPQPYGAAITWTATATGSVMPLQYRFERQDNGAWTTVQAYSSTNTYTWTPTAADAGDHALRVSVRNGGAVNDFDDTATMSYTITLGSGTLVHPRQSQFLLARLRRAAPVSLSLTMSPAAVGDLQRYSFYSPELHLIGETELTTSTTPPIAHEYIWFNGQPVAQYDTATSTTHWTFTDHLGTPNYPDRGQRHSGLARRIRALRQRLHLPRRRPPPPTSQAARSGVRRDHRVRGSGVQHFQVV